jgi:hypothetical protein
MDNVQKYNIYVEENSFMSWAISQRVQHLYYIASNCRMTADSFHILCNSLFTIHPVA